MKQNSPWIHRLGCRNIFLENARLRHDRMLSNSVDQSCNGMFRGLVIQVCTVMEQNVGHDRLSGHRRLMVECLMNRGILVDGEGLQDTECPASRLSKCRKLN